MRIALSADHAGYVLKDELAAWLREAGHDVSDLGTNGPDSVDYPEFGKKLAEAVASGEVERGIAVCGTGIGISIAINRNPHCRCARVDDDGHEALRTTRGAAIARGSTAGHRGAFRAHSHRARRQK